MLKDISPKKLFLIDALGALFSAFMLGVVLVYFQDEIGIPAKALFILAGIPILFFCYSILCFSFLEANHSTYLKLIAIANISYCLLSLSLISYYFHQLTTLGIAYFTAEIIVILMLSIVELKISKIDATQQ